MNEILSIYCPHCLLRRHPGADCDPEAVAEVVAARDATAKVQRWSPGRRQMRNDIMAARRRGSIR